MCRQALGFETLFAFRSLHTACTAGILVLEPSSSHLFILVIDAELKILDLGWELDST